MAVVLQIKTGFEPIFDKESKILILGSFPSRMSFEAEFYYGNPRNRFWKILQEFFNVELTSVESKKIFLLHHHIALWDIVSRGSNMQGNRESSMDKNLLPTEISPIDTLLAKTKIKTILCNGKKAYLLFCEYYPHLKNIAKCLPSTSPANVKFDSQPWKIELSQIK
ncbi:DNA-deoxyinosine glycosylase [Helicobacter turcicus]|uniref:DNA-deoxyinosine glycosylase n=1 Tax=Helicobacter turcicus TaxID=2867412 RepID=A0ABS7JMX7_9HELI|nr:DNA-deoxyinosine glycosylase [Helicobacter turcicus]MBX7490742.1 DNA-deoxyinosine glycosylase [Helicobacter turcicus]MBX7545649.1 DNA-deoxyinosine glycosylase [Helicobacter turcicus]